MNDLSSAMRQEQEQNERAELLSTLRKLVDKIEALEKQVASLKKPSKAD